VPLGDAYIELLGAVDQGEAQGNDFGRWVLDRVADGEAWMGWCVRTDDLDATCERLKLDALPMSRSRPDGFELRWRLAGLQQAQENPSLPFFISWEVPDDERPGRGGGEVQASGARLAAVEVGADEHELTDWLGELPGTVRIASGPPGVHSVAVAGDAGAQVVRPSHGANA
jgi:hypothetical protein